MRRLTARARSISAVAATLMVTTGTTAAPAADSVDSYIASAMVRQHIPGLSLVVLRHGKIVKSKGYGLASVELNSPALPGTVYELASATKPLVATAILLLVQDGTVQLDDSLSAYITATPESWKGITIRQLLTHTSGIKDYLADLGRDFPHNTTADQFAKAMMEEPLKFPPGDKWSYSNTGYVLLGMVVQAASGRSYDAFLRERVFEPLGMSATRRDTPDGVVANRSSGYLWYGQGGFRNGDYLKYLMMNHGDRGILSSAVDLAKWDMALSGNRLLSNATRDAMWTPLTLNDGSKFGYGLGWFVDDVNGHAHVFHPGGAPGSATIISRYPNDSLTVILLTNGGGAYVQALELGVAQRYIPSLVSRKTIRLSTRVLDSYTGYYNAYGSQVLKVTREGRSLVLDDGGRLANVFLPLSDTTFVAEDADRGATVVRAVDGTVTGIVLRLIGDRVNIQRLGSLARQLTAAPDPDPLTQRVQNVLGAFSLGGRAVELVEGVAQEARKDFARGPSPEFSGIRLLFAGAQDVTGRGIERHRAQVSRVLYYRLLTNHAHYVLVYMTGDGLVTDADIVSE